MLLQEYLIIATKRRWSSMATIDNRTEEEIKEEQEGCKPVEGDE